MAVGEGGVTLAGPARGDRLIDRRVERLEGVREPLDVTPREGGRAPAGVVEDRRVAEEQLAGAASMSDPQLVGALRVPRGGGLRSVDLEDQRVLAAGADLGDRHRAPGAILEAEQDRGRVLRLHLPFAAPADEGHEVGHRRPDPLAEEERGEVHPVRADVGDGAQVAAEMRVDAPVPVRVLQQPVLQVVPGHEPHLAELAGRDHAVHVLAYGIEAQVVVDRVHELRLFGGAQEVGRFGGGRGQRLLAHDMLPRLEGGPGLGVVQVVR